MLALRNWSKLLSAAIHLGVAAFLFLAVGDSLSPPKPPRAVILVGASIAPYVPPVSKTASHKDPGGGGDRSPTPASFGMLPKAAPRQFTPPMAVVHNEHPMLTMEPSILVSPDIELPVVMAANWGLPNGVPGPPSNGRGSGSGIGDGKGGGVGDEDGPGYGPGSRGDGTAVRAGGGSISPPAVLWMIEPEYTDEARKAKIQGMVVLYIDVDGAGKPCHFRVEQGLGLGLDERAMEAVSRWKFRPGYRNGRPVLTSARVEVRFRLL